MSGVDDPNRTSVTWQSVWYHGDLIVAQGLAEARCPAQIVLVKAFDFGRQVVESRVVDDHVVGHSQALPATRL